MIRSESEYKEAVQQLKVQGDRLAKHEQDLKQQGLSAAEIKRAMDPVRSFHQQLVEEIETYEKLKRGEIDDVQNLRSIGHLLICLRIARGLTQRELADKLGIHESQVSRDERNEYHGITLDRAAKTLEVLGVDLSIGVHHVELI